MKKFFIGILVLVVILQGVLLVPSVRQWIGDELEARKYKVVDFDHVTLSVVNDEGFEYREFKDRTFSEFVTDDRIFMPASFLEAFDYHVYYEGSTNRLYVGDLGNQVVYDVAKETLMVLGNDALIPTSIQTVGDEVYIDVQELSNYLSYTIKMNREAKSVMLTQGENVELQVKENTRIFPGSQYTYDMMAEYETPSLIITNQKEENDFVQVLSDKYQVGYVNKSMVNDVQATSIENDDKYRIKLPDGKKVYMFWEAVYEAKVDTNQIGGLDGVNVVSPTWYDLKGTDGTLRSKVDEDYIAWAKARGYQIWALATNSFDLELTHGMLSNPTSRKQVIDKLVSDANYYKFEGINIDFENVYLKDKDALTQFMLELTTEAHKYGIMTSIDVTAISTSETWSMFYDRKALGKIVDYMCVMSYDQYWASSPVSGPVASYPWVKNVMEEIAQVVDRDRLVLGLPTYIRIWHERPSNEAANAMTNQSYAITMQRAEELKNKYSGNYIYDSANGLYYSSYVTDGYVAKMWIDNAETLGLRASLVKENGYAGVGLWSRGFETQDVWSIIKQAIE